MSGSIPVLISVICQVFFEIYGPYSFLNGLIIWFQRPPVEWNGATGIFNNPNYLAGWLLMVFPFSISFLFRSSLSKRKYFFLIVLNAIFISSMLLSISRNAISGMLLTFLIIFGKKFIMIILLLLILFALIFSVNQIMQFQIINILLNKFIFEDIILKFANLNLSTILRLTRVDIWINSIKYISSKPIFGIGVGVFPILYEVRENIWGRHAHNLFIEIALNYGLLASLFISLGFLLLIFRSFKINRKLNFFDKSWRLSALIFIYSQLFDVTYYDGRISILCWLVFAGLRSLEKEKSLVITASKLPNI